MKGDGAAFLLLCRWRELIEEAAKLPALDPTSPAVAKLLPALVELADDTDRFIDDVTNGPEARA